MVLLHAGKSIPGRDTLDDRNRGLIAWLILLGLVLPKGIGVSVVGNAIDLNKLLLLGSVLMTAGVRMGKSWRIRGFSLYVWLLIAACLALSGSWVSGAQYLFFAYYVVMYVSAIWVSAYLFEDRVFFCRFTNNLSAALIIAGILALIDHQYRLITFEYLRPEQEAFIHEYSRGAAFGAIEIVSYKGFDSVTHWFAMDRFVWLAWGAVAYLYSLRTGDPGLNRNVLLLATMLGAFEILLSQGRVLSVFAIVVLTVVLVVAAVHRRGNRIYPVAAGIALIAASIALEDRVLYFLRNMYSLFDFWEIDLLKSGLSYSFEIDKRGQALVAIGEHLSETETYLPAGPLFYNFTEWFLGVPSEYFDDLTPLVTSAFEIGAVPWMMVMLLVVYVVAARKDGIGWLFAVILAAVLLSSVANFSPRFYYYFFFVLGGLLARRLPARASRRGAGRPPGAVGSQPYGSGLGVLESASGR